MTQPHLTHAPSIYRAKPKTARKPATSAPEPYVLAKAMAALEAEVVAAAEAPVAEALLLPEEPVEEAVADDAALVDALAWEVTFFFPQVTDWQVAWPTASSGWSATH